MSVSDGLFGGMRGRELTSDLTDPLPRRAEVLETYRAAITNMKSLQEVCCLPFCADVAKR
jgi:hypothetical protein